MYMRDPMKIPVKKEEFTLKDNHYLIINLKTGQGIDLKTGQGIKLKKHAMTLQGRREAAEK